VREVLLRWWQVLYFQFVELKSPFSFHHCTYRQREMAWLIFMVVFLALQEKIIMVGTKVKFF
jgi:hypothetical protein